MSTTDDRRRDTDREAAEARALLLGGSGGREYVDPCPHATGSAIVFHGELYVVCPGCDKVLFVIDTDDPETDPEDEDDDDAPPVSEESAWLAIPSVPPADPLSDRDYEMAETLAKEALR